MGTYGPGEIAELCEWLDPEVSVITAIGPVHLERFGSEERVLQAKAEIVANCKVAVLATDDPRLAALADRLTAEGRAVVRCSSEDAAADVVVERISGANGTLRVKIRGRVVKDGLNSPARESNLASAIGVVAALGLPVEAALGRLDGLPSAAHRLESVRVSGGALVLDDTYNSNPAGSAVALSVLADVGARAERRVVVTPGMVELGRLQQRENAALGRSAAAVATDLVVVGRTNRRALLEGAPRGLRRWDTRFGILCHRSCHPAGRGCVGQGECRARRRRALRERLARPLPLTRMSSGSVPGGANLALGVCFGGPSPEHDVSVLTGLQAAHELLRAGRRVTGLYWSKTGDWYEIDPSLEASSFVEGVPRSAQSLRLVTGPGGGFVSGRGRGVFAGGSSRTKTLDVGSSRTKTLDVGVVVNCCHGGPGEDGSLQGAFDLAGLRYTGPGVAGAALGMDKLAFAGLAAEAGLPVLQRALIDDTTSEEQLGFKGPFIVKPRFGGSSIGVVVAADFGTAKDLLRTSLHFHAGAVVEPFRSDLFDLNMAVRTWPTLDLSAAERPERTSAGAEILGYSDKYTGGEGMASAPRELPAWIPDELLEQMRAVALRAAKLIGVRGVARVDFLSDGSSELWLNEINTIPGSLARYLWVDPAVPFARLLEGMIEEAEQVPASHMSAAGADGTVLRLAGSIEGKLG